MATAVLGARIASRPITSTVQVERLRYNNLIWLAAMAVMAATYFELVRHYYVVKMLGGYVAKIWVPPAAMLGVVGVMKLLNRRLMPPGRGLTVGHAFLAGYVVFGTLSLFATEGAWNIGKFGLIMFAPVALYMVIIEVATDNRRIEMMLVMLFILGVAGAAYTEYVFQRLETGTIQLDPIPTNVGEVAANENVRFGLKTVDRVARHTFPGLEQSKYAAMLGSLVLIGLYFSIKRSRPVALVCLGGSALMFYSAIATLGRSSTISIVVGLVVYAWYNRHKLFGLAVVVAGVATMVGNGYIIDRLVYTFASPGFEQSKVANALLNARQITQRGTPEDHFDTLPRSIEMFESSPWFGVGISEMQAEVAGVEDHDRYTYLLSTAGALTTVPYVAFIGWLIWKTRRVFLSSSERRWPSADLGCALFAATVLCAVKLFAENTETFYYWGIFGLTAAWVRNTLSGWALPEDGHRASR